MIDLRDRSVGRGAASLPRTPRENVELRQDLLDLVRLVLDDDFSPEEAGARLRHVVRGERALRVLRARVWRVQQERSTPTSALMLAAIEAALAPAANPHGVGPSLTMSVVERSPAVSGAGRHRS